MMDNEDKKKDRATPVKDPGGEDRPEKKEERKIPEKKERGDDYPKREPDEDPYIGDNPDEIRRRSPKL